MLNIKYELKNIVDFQVSQVNQSQRILDKNRHSFRRQLEGIAFYPISVGKVWTKRGKGIKHRKDTKKEIVTHMKTEVDELIEIIEDPKSVFKDFIPLTWNPTKKIFDGQSLVLELTAYEYIKNPETVGMFYYKTVDAIANIKLDLEGYAQLVNEIDTFHYKVASLNDEQTKNFLDKLMDKEKLGKKTLIDNLKKLKKLLNEIQSNIP